MDAPSCGPPKVVSGNKKWECARRVFPGILLPRNSASQARNAAAGPTSTWWWVRSGSVAGAFVCTEAFHAAGRP